MEKNEEDLPDIEELDIPDYEKFEKLFLICKMFGESVPLYPKSFSIKIEKRTDVAYVYKDSFLAD